MIVREHLVYPVKKYDTFERVGVRTGTSGRKIARDNIIDTDKTAPDRPADKRQHTNILLAVIADGITNVPDRTP